MKRTLCLVLVLAALVRPLPAHAGAPTVRDAVLQNSISGTVSYAGGGPGPANITVVCRALVLQP